MSTTRIIVIAKAPIPGFAKTRLIPALGATQAARLAQRMLEHAVNAALEADVGVVELCAAPAPSDPAWARVALPDGLAWSDQGNGDLGTRMARAAHRALSAGESVLLIGTDCPALGAQALQASTRALHEFDAAMIPTADGGYALLGLNRFHRAIFDDMPWSTEDVAAETLRRFGQLGWTVTCLQRLHDIDEPTDLKWLPEQWQKDISPLVPGP
jgi:rSAM/selenodomain-associated transferase 1